MGKIFAGKGKIMIEFLGNLKIGDPVAIYFIVWGLNLYTIFVFPV